MNELVYYILVFIFGACIGSFLNVVIWRLPRDQKLGGWSQCPNCHHRLGAIDLVPVFSYLASRRRCRYCQKPILPRYWMIELITASLFVFVASQMMPLVYADYLYLAMALFVAAVCIAVFVIDLEHYLILDKIVFTASAIVLVLLIAMEFAYGGQISPRGLVANHIFAGLVASLFFGTLWLVSRGRWMGLGDVKFAGFMGLVLGWPAILVGLFLAFILGSLVGIPLILSGRKQFSSKIPFGTFLAVSTIISLLWGIPLVDWYLSLISF